MNILILKVSFEGQTQKYSLKYKKHILSNQTVKLMEISENDQVIRDIIVIWGTIKAIQAALLTSSRAQLKPSGHDKTHQGMIKHIRA